MSPEARKVLSSVFPFWTWTRAAYRFVYLTMPAHHPIQTGILADAANATQTQREAAGLDKRGERPLPSFLQGGIPTPGGGEVSLANINSFGYAQDPVSAITRGWLTQIRGPLEALGGVQGWKGSLLPGGESDHIAAAFWQFVSSYVPGANLLMEENEGQKTFTPHIPLPVREYDKSYLEYKRRPTQQITVPATGSGGSSGAPPIGSIYSSGSSASSSGGAIPIEKVYSGGIDYGKAFAGGSNGTGIDYGKVFSGGG